MIEFALQLLRSGQSPATCRTSIAEEFVVGVSTCAVVIQRALTVLDTELTDERPHHRAMQVHRLIGLIERAMANDKFADAIRAETVLSQILGTRAPTQIEVNTDQAVRDAFSKIATSISVADRERMIEEQAQLEANLRQQMNGGSRHG